MPRVRSFIRLVAYAIQIDVQALQQRRELIDIRLAEILQRFLAGRIHDGFAFGHPARGAIRQ